MSYSRDIENKALSNVDTTIIEPETISSQTKERTWPLYLISHYILSPLTSKEVKTRDDETPAYPPSSGRYNAYGWNANYQHCYTQDDITLLQKIHALHKALSEDKSAVYFGLQEESKWHDFWTCTQPVYTMQHQLEPDSFTLPSRESKDAKHYPLWSYADNLAKQIANWQGERIKDQPTNRRNDPVMLAFEELKDWFFNVLSQKECKKDVLDEIATRLSYVKNLNHIVPNFGPDRLHLLDIQHGLEESSNILKNCMASRELPQLLSDVVITGTSLETIIATYAHYLLINENVADNFSHKYLEGEKQNCHLSPVCKIYKSASSSNKDTPDLSRFYDLVKIDEKDNTMHLKMALKQASLDSIKFASFVTARDKSVYLETIATLDALMNTRKTLERFHNVQSKLGSYVFAVNYLDKANQLASHYIKLINKTKLLTKHLIKRSDEGLQLLLQNHQSNTHEDIHFEKNLRTLETRFAKGTTVDTQLEAYCAHAIDTMNKYQHAMQQLVTDVNSGQASRDLENAMQDLLLQMNYMNTVLPALLGDPQLMVSNTGSQAVICDASDNSICTINTSPSTTVALPSPSTQEIISTAQERVHEVEAFHVFPDNFPFDSGKWDEDIKQDRYTGKPIFTYRVYDGNKEIGSAQFYGSPILCQSKDGQHNLIKTTGILKQFQITSDMTIDEVCASLPPTLFDKILLSATEGATHGFLRGGSNVLGVTLQSYGVSKTVAYYLSQLTYYGSVFTLRFHNYYQQMQDYDDTSEYLNAMYYAALDTGSIWLTNLVLNQVTNLVNMAGDYIERSYNALVGQSIKKVGGLLRFGIYARNAAENGLFEASAATLSGMTAEVVTESVGNYALSKWKASR